MGCLPESIPTPAWVEFRPKPIDGLDLLGLRMPVQMIGQLLFDGVTTVTPVLRYFSLRTWLAERYRTSEPAREDTNEAFVSFAEHAEAAFVFANLTADLQTPSLIGRNKGGVLVTGGEAVLPADALVKQAAVQIYANPSDHLHLTWPRAPKAPGITAERGAPLAAAVEPVFGTTAVGRRLQSEATIDSLTREEIEEFAEVAMAYSLPEAERTVLGNAILPAAPKPGEHGRVATLGLLLALSDQRQRAPMECDVFREATARNRAVPAIFHPSLNRWLYYLIRDALAVTHEAILASIVSEVRDQAGLGGAGAEATEVVGALLSDLSQVTAVLADLGLAGPDEDVGGLPFRILADRVRESCAEDELIEDGLVRWKDGLSEWGVYAKVARRGPAALATAAIAWLLVEWRAARAVELRLPDSRLLSHEGLDRFGVRQVVIPTLAAWQAADLPVGQVLANLAQLTIGQHQRIVWLRLAADPRKDIAVLTREGSRWIARKSYEGGRTASRLDVAISWLKQLGWIEDGGLTPDGRGALERAIFATREVEVHTA